VDELEAALRKAVAHMRAVPLSPATNGAANAAQQVLDREASHTPPPCYEGVIQMIGGAPLIMA